MSRQLNPGLLKLDLFCKGIRIDESCRLQVDARPILRTRGGLGSGLELILPGNLYINVPLEEHFVKASPYLLVREKGAYFIRREGNILCSIILPPKPKFYDRKTTSGKTMSRIGVLQGTYLGIYPTRVCEFWNMEPKMNCRFCSVGLNIGHNEDLEKTIEDVVETAKSAQAETKITFVHFNTGYLGGKALDELESYIKAVKKETGLLIGVQCPPAPNLSKYDYLKKIGVDHISFCLELYNPQRFKEICPGKYKYITQQSYFDAMQYCVKIFGKGKVAGEVIAGLEEPQATIRAVEDFARAGAVSTICIFRPCIGTDLEKLLPPKTEKMIPIFRRMYEVCLENNIPIGIAPNVKVSLVLLPEEGRYFLSKKATAKYFIPQQKLKILKMLFRAFFRTKMFLFRKTKLGR
ncbi:MAG: hypothetical protein ISS47_01220 [Candidatus Omnitrophica bacterium]|nr:hypothetical protein [Candidatus Omnitrophota bacterium]